MGSETKNTAIDKVLFECSYLLKPLIRINSAQNVIGFFNELGYKLPASNLFQNGFPALISEVDNLIDNAKEIVSNAESENYVEIVKNVKESIESIIYIINDAESLRNEIERELNTFPEFITDSGILSEELPKRLIEYLLSIYLQNRFPRLYSIFHLFGFVEYENIIASNSWEPASEGVVYSIRRIYWERIGALFSDPISIANDVYLWNTDFDGDKFLKRLEILLRAFLLPGGIYTQKQSIRQGFGRTDDDNKEIRMPIFQGGVWSESYMELDLNICPIPYTPAQGDKPEQKAGIAIYPYFFGNLDIVKEIADNWLLNLGGSIEPKDAGLCIKLRPPANLELVTSLFANPVNNLDATFEVGLTRTSSPDSMIYIFGAEEGSHLALKEASIKFKATSQRDTPEFSATLNVKDFTIAINPGGDGDGFIQKLLSGINIKSISDLGIGVSNTQGVYFEGSSALEIKIPTHLELGPLTIDSATVGVSINNSDFGILLASDFSVNMGPLFAGVEDIGLTIPLSFPEGGNGNLGPVQISAPKFKPPKGVALSIDAEVVKGGGYLRFEPERGEYSGAMELTFQDFLSLKAIGLINTKMPDGSDGFSMLIIITAEFTIQIGMGFVFLGAGGLLGLHRTANLDALAQGVRSGSTENIMFPTNVVENAPQIISDIKVFFPIQQNHFLIGPMIKLGYGQPPLISLTLGVIIEIKTDDGGNLERIAILGVLKCILPEEEAAILVLQVNFIGAIDFRKKTGFFFASIFESRILFLTIEGEMGLLVAWGNNSNFVVSVGGFHPCFNPPALPFPVPKRIAISILNKSWGKIRVEGYFAVTTNTVQFGAKIEVKFGMDDFKIQGHMAFDVLFQFNPFFFIVSISGKVALTACGMDMLSISLKFSLEGPTPWRAKGYGKIKILFVTFKAKFDKKWGSSKNTKLPPIKVFPILYREFSNSQNWEAIAPASNRILVTVREIPKPENEEDEVFVLHPVGRLKVSQRAVPLEIKIDKVGDQKPSDANKLQLDIITGYLESGGDFKESFPPAQYFKMSASKKLSEPATRKYVGGSYIKAKTGETNVPSVAVRHVRYELIRIDTAYQRHQEKFFESQQLLFDIFLRNNAAARSLRSHRMKKQAQPFDSKINVKGGSYTVVNAMNNMPYNEDSINFETPWEAEKYIENNTDAVGQVQVIPTNEVNF